jgi:ATP-dependent helicase HrpB
MLEPRRAAVLGIAGRMAELLGEEPGNRIGYAVRFERKVSPRTRIEVLTEGLLIRRIQADPGLRGVGTIVFDEFHERSVYTDLALALVMDLRRMGSKTRLLIMSATMNAQGLAAFVGAIEGGGPPVIDCPGRVFPVAISYLPLPEKAPLGGESAAALKGILKKEKDRDVLVFLPGKKEIADAGGLLRGEESLEILPLHGSLPLSVQRRVLAPRPSAQVSLRRRIILSTNVAETGLTIPGITLVVDSGYARMERYHIPTGMNRLCPEPISVQSADQRAGRAGRLMPGHCVRLWDKAQVRPPETSSEISRIDLSALVLECLLWGVRERTELPWFETPPEAAWSRALELLRNLGAVDENLTPTGRGREMVILGLEPRLAALCLAGRDAGKAPLACAAAAILSGRAGSGSAAGGDFGSRLALVRKAAPGGENPWLREVVRTGEDLLRRLHRRNRAGDTSLRWEAAEEGYLGKLLGTAFPDRIAQYQDRGRFRFPGGREARIEGALENAPWVVAPEVDAGERLGFIRLASPLSREEALELLAGKIQAETRISWTGLNPRTILVRSAGRLVIEEEKRPSFREEAAGDLPRLLKKSGLSLLPWEEEKGAPKRLLDRIRFFAAHGAGKAAEFTDWSGEALINDAAVWLCPFIWDAGEQGPVITGKGLIRALETRLNRNHKIELDRLVPETFSLPNGKKRPLLYNTGEPVLSLRLQDAFGIPSESKILSFNIVFHLLSPADRPIQITRDLAGFWAGSYSEVRKEMRGRYPKHHWPEDPNSLLRL